MKVYRVIEYDGPEDWVQMVIGRSIHGTWVLTDTMKITAAEVHLRDEEELYTLMRMLERARGEVWVGWRPWWQEGAHGESSEV